MCIYAGILALLPVSNKLFLSGPADKKPSHSANPMVRALGLEDCQRPSSKKKEGAKIMNTRKILISILAFAVTGIALLGVRANTVEAHVLAVGQIADSSIIDGKIAFVSIRDGNREIYTINPNGSGVRRLTFSPTEDDYPAWSPDGRKIAYLSEVPHGAGQALMKIMNADGSGQQVVTVVDISVNEANFCGERFALDWSPDGSKIVFQEFGNIVTVNIDGTNRQNVTDTSVRESEPSWGLMNQITYTTSIATNSQPNAGLWIRLTTFPEVFFSDYGYYTCAVSPDLSADGAKLAYIGGHDLVPPGAIFITNPNPPFNERSLGFFNAMTVRWSPTGDFLVFGSLTSSITGQRHIEIVGEFGQGRRTLTEGFNPSWGKRSVAQATPADFDGDGRSDISVFRPSANNWYVTNGAGYSVRNFGAAGDVAVPADYDGDGKTDIAVWRPSNGQWHLLTSGGQFQVFEWGEIGDLPAPADHDGDGRADLVLFRPSNSTWYTRFASGGFAYRQFGQAGDKPVFGDFDGNGQTNIAVFRPSNNTWYVQNEAGFYSTVFGEFGDIPIPADYDGDGATDIATFRPSTGSWYWLGSTDGFRVFSHWGVVGDMPVPADYDGDNKADPAVFRPSNSTWYIFATTAGITVLPFGQSGDKAIPNAFVY